jgi:peptide/histidine transporter 3/4
MTNRCGIEVTMLRKIGGGFFLAAMSMLAAGLVERARLAEFKAGHIIGGSVCAKKDDTNPPSAVSLSIFYQIVQFALVGSSEVLAAVTSLQFFYTQAPESMKSVCAALNLLTTAIGTWLMAGLIPIVNSRYPFPAFVIRSFPLAGYFIR